VTIDPEKVRVKLLEMGAQLTSTFVERDDAVKAILLALVTRNNFILVGDPGTAKTKLARAAFAHVTQARVFATLCGAFATEDKIFGPVDLEQLKQNRWARAVKGRLADCELGFLDEVLKSNIGTINSMLTAMNEREYECQPIPLRTCGAATNWPEVRAKTEHAAAFWDRFMIRVPVKKLEDQSHNGTNVQGQPQQKRKPVNKDRLRMLKQARSIERYAPRTTVTLAELDAVHEAIAEIPIPDAIFNEMLVLADVILQIKLDLSDRRLVNLLRILQAHAWIYSSERGEDKLKVRIDDFEVVKFCAWESTEQQFDAVHKIVAKIDQDNVKQVVDRLTNAIRQCKQASDPSQAPNFAKQATETAKWINEFIKTNAIRRENWNTVIQPLIDQLKAEKARMEGLIKGAQPQGARP
jgi:MoxR-like ATPase